jgi:hypothetical protein
MPILVEKINNVTEQQIESKKIDENEQGLSKQPESIEKSENIEQDNQENNISLPSSSPNLPPQDSNNMHEAQYKEERKEEVESMILSTETESDTIINNPPQ